MILIFVCELFLSIINLTEFSTLLCYICYWSNTVLVFLIYLKTFSIRSYILDTNNTCINLQIFGHDSCPDAQLSDRRSQGIFVRGIQCQNCRAWQEIHGSFQQRWKCTYICYSYLKPLIYVFLNSHFAVFFGGCS